MEAELLIFELFLTMMVFSNLLFVLARLVVECCCSCSNLCFRLLLLLLYLANLVYFSASLFLNSLDYLQAEYWRLYKWVDLDHLVKDRTSIQLGAWLVICVTIVMTCRLFLYGAIAFVKENYQSVHDMFLVRLSVYNPFEDEQTICQRYNCGQSMFECEECILIDDKYYFHIECAKVELVQNRYKSLFSQKFDVKIPVNL